MESGWISSFDIGYFLRYKSNSGISARIIC